MKFIIEKSHNGRSNDNLFTIAKSSMVIRKDIIDRLNLGIECFANIAIDDDNDLCLVISKNKDHRLYRFSKNKTKNKLGTAMYCTISQKYKDQIMYLRGDYTLGKPKLESGLFKIKLKKENDGQY